MNNPALWFYYLRDKQNHPLITVCLIKGRVGDIYRGMAICSEKDKPNKLLGKLIAVGRAQKAIDNKEESGLINRKEALDVLNKVIGDSDIYKSSNNPVLTEFEVNLLCFKRSSEYDDLNKKYGYKNK